MQRSTGESSAVNGTREGRLDEERRRQGGMEGQSPVVWEWSSALHRGGRFLLLPPLIPHHHHTHHNPLTSSPFAPPPLLKIQLHNWGAVLLLKKCKARTEKIGRIKKAPNSIFVSLHSSKVCCLQGRKF